MSSARRLIEKKRPRVSLKPYLGITITANGNKQVFDPNVIRIEFTAMLNGGELVQAEIIDPYFSKFDKIMGKDYFESSRNDACAPIDLSTDLHWDGDSELAINPQLTHAVAAIWPSGSGNAATINILAVDYASYYLNGGDAGGYCYTGNVQDVVKQIVQKYSRGAVQLTLDTKTKDSKYNKWWQMRLDPKTLIISLLEWSTPLTQHQTRWLLYPEDKKLRIVEQGEMDSKHRADYMWRGYGGDQKGTGDILEWEFAGDNALQMYENQLVTGGISAVSVVYYDQSQFKKSKQKTFVGDQNTSDKIIPNVPKDKSYTRPNPDSDPLTGSVGWSFVQAIPEFSGGDLGIKYDQYMDGRARSMYLAFTNTFLRARFTVFGHHIWGCSEGLGVDTIGIKITTENDSMPYFFDGSWMIYGFKHVATRDEWITELYASRYDYNSSSVKVGPSDG